jgi:hypothetical protein
MTGIVVIAAGAGGWIGMTGEMFVGTAGMIAGIAGMIAGTAGAPDG